MAYLVSIIMPTYNAEHTVLDTINSILEQTYNYWELIVTDDCSSDRTMEILKNYAARDNRIKIYQNEKNFGAAVSRNNCIANSEGEFIAFIDSDDLWYPTKLEKQVSWMVTNKNVNFSFTAYELIDSSSNKLNKIIDLQGDGLKFSYNDMLMKKATMGCSTVVIKKKAFSDISMPLLRTGQDYALWLKLLKQGGYAYLINDVLTKYRIMPNSISRNKLKKARRQWQIYREVEFLTFNHALVCFISYAWRAVIRK